MKQRKFGFILCLLIALVCIVDIRTYAQIYASSYINGYAVSALRGNNRGEIYIEADIAAYGAVSKIGVLKIEIYQSNGNHVTTIYGTTSNGLLSPIRSSSHALKYTYMGIPGVSYYAKVTLCAGTASDYDTRVVRTQTVQAPK